MLCVALFFCPCLVCFPPRPLEMIKAQGLGAALAWQSPRAMAEEAQLFASPMGCWSLFLVLHWCVGPKRTPFTEFAFLVLFFSFWWGGGLLKVLLGFSDRRLLKSYPDRQRPERRQGMLEFGKNHWQHPERMLCWLVFST